MFDVHPRVAMALSEAPPDAVRVWDHTKLARPINSPADFAEVLGYDPNRIAKSMLLANRASPVHRRLREPTGEYGVICLPAPCRTDLQGVANHFGWSKTELARPDELGELLDYPSRGVSPLGIRGIPLLLDVSVMAFPTVLVGAGRVGLEIEIAPSLLLALTRATVCVIVGPPTRVGPDAA